MILYGSSLSPYVRKVLAFASEKGIELELKPTGAAPGHPSDEFLAASPAKDLEKNLRALLSAAFSRLDLATREELEIQIKVLARTRQKLAELEARVAELEAGLGQK